MHEAIFSQNSAFYKFRILGFGIVPGALLVVLRAFSLGLVFDRDPNPDADGLGFIHFF